MFMLIALIHSSLSRWIFLIMCVLGILPSMDAQCVGQLWGRVVDEKGGSLEGVGILVEKKHSWHTTDEKGIFIVSNLLAGYYELTLSGPGVETKRYATTVDPGEMTSLQLQLRRQVGEYRPSTQKKRRRKNSSPK